MARPGYIEARKARDAAAEYVAEKEIALDNVRFADLIPELKEIHRADAQKALDAARAVLERTEQAFASYSNPRIKSEPAHYNVHFAAHISLDYELHGLMLAKQREENISTAEILRRGLRAYLIPTT